MRPMPVQTVALARVRTAAYSRRSLLNENPLRHYTQNTANNSPAPHPHTSSMLPYFVGGVAGMLTVGMAGYAYYHFSGAKKIVDKTKAVKVRVQAQTAIAQEKGEAAREKMGDLNQTARDMAREKRGDLQVRWAARFSHGKESSDGPTEVSNVDTNASIL
ncbi:hypothetical protein C8Q80DRAFT_866076 [Daedaleopsis nitida]|nr:hypothetical protein C8Q80DRAFT_866076 [Daedaleopsis nitida]